MLLQLISFSVGVLGIIFGVAVIIWTKKQNKKSQAEVKPVATEVKTNAVATPPAAPTIVISKDKTAYKQFLDEYDGTKDLQFGNISFRLGAQNTCDFGMSEGYRIVDKKFIWDSVRIHTGIDRAGGGAIKTLKDAIVSPFNFNSTEFYDYGDKGYGSLVIFNNLKYKFSLRVAHMKPDINIIPWSLEQFKAGKPFNQGWLIGSAGNYGDSDGAHTHSEIVSIGATSEVLDQLLYEKFGSLSLKEYTSDEVMEFYKTRGFFKRKSEKDILEHWNGLKLAKKIHFMNKYLYRRVLDNGQHMTYYNSWTLFNM